MRKFVFCLICLALLFTASALAETYSFNEINASVDIPKDYEVVLTPFNLSANAAWMERHGMDYDATLNEFEAEGILLQAYDAENNRVFVLSALADLDGQTYFDLNNQDEAMRKEFRTNHTNGIGYSTLGYSYSSAKWVNYKGTTLRFLQTKYSLRQDGQQVCTGYQRRTIRNGYTITLDMQVRDRAAKEADNTALEKIMKTFTFSQILPMPEVPVKLSISSAPPTETNEDTFTIKGTTGKNANVTATVVSLGSGGSKNYNVTAGKNGAFSIKVTLPAQGVYSVTLTSEAEGAKTAQRLYSVTFRQGMLPVDITLSPNAVLSDSTVISGSTIGGAKTQLSVSGPVNFSKTSTSKTFKFTVDTSAPGTYQFVLAVTKKGLEERVFTYTGTRTYTDAELEARMRSSAKKVTYAQLSKNIAEGKTVTFTGYLTAINPSIDEWVLTVAMTKSGSSYKNSVYVISKTQPQFVVDDQVKLYGTYSGKYSVLDADGNVKTYPRVDAILIEAL
ncbi:MAG: hypothetical protein IJ662_04045 [Clostridia bacterium]|nr:hypothetical protein [Clostridia bacterium]